MGPHQHQRASAALLPVDESVSDVFKASILDGMAHDEIVFIVRQDQLIITLGKRMFAKSGREAHELQYVRQNMRELGQLLLQVRKLDRSVHTLQECIDPTKFQLVVEAVRVVNVYDGWYTPEKEVG